MTRVLTPEKELLTLRVDRVAGGNRCVGNADAAPWSFKTVAGRSRASNPNNPKLHLMQIQFSMPISESARENPRDPAVYPIDEIPLPASRPGFIAHGFSGNQP
jgi:hypothetical protein